MTDMCDRPLAAPGLASYRYPSAYGGWIMIAAKDAADALREAARSTPAAISPALLQVRDGAAYKAG